jgi:predicted transcriptional regulator
MDFPERDILSSGRRDRTEIIAAIVALTRKTSNITQIMSTANMSYQLTAEYIDFMSKKNLIEKILTCKTGKKTAQYYRATEKGLICLKTYCEILDLIYGKDYLRKGNNLAIVCLQYCPEV